jgi:meso-butanediol dehydrogenase/(S,S)-butanediol dehydrogenase/diacetyl reductase
MDILITGSTGVIGTAIARTLSRRGFALHLTSRQPEPLAHLKKELSGTPVHTYMLDLSNPENGRQVVDAFFKNAPKPYGLVCNAGNMGALGLFTDTAFKDWSQGITENFLSHAAMIQAFASQLQIRKYKEGAVVVFSGAGVGGNGSFSNMTSYSTAKAAMVHLAEALSGEFSRLGITINAVAPGPVVSGMTSQALNAGPRAGEQAQRAQECKTSGGVPPDLAAEAVAYLLGPEARSITGRMVSARFDMKTVAANVQQIEKDPNLYRLRRIDNEVFSAKPK